MVTVRTTPKKGCENMLKEYLLSYTTIIDFIPFFFSVPSDRHKEEYTNRRNSTPQSSSTQRKRQRMELDKELQWVQAKLSMV